MYHDLPQPHEVPIREREDGMGAYLMMFAAMAVGLPLPILNLLAAFIYYQINKKKSKYVNFHALQSLLSQLPTTLLNAILLGWAIRYGLADTWPPDMFWGYLILVVLVNLVYFIFSIVAAVKARKGKFFYFILFGPIAYKMAYKIRPEEDKNAIINKPPL